MCNSSAVAAAAALGSSAPGRGSSSNMFTPINAPTAVSSNPKGSKVNLTGHNRGTDDVRHEIRQSQDDIFGGASYGQPC